MKASPVNWAPWSVLKISGRPLVSASSRASTQKSASRVFDRRQESTYRLLTTCPNFGNHLKDAECPVSSNPLVQPQAQIQ